MSEQLSCIHSQLAVSESDLTVTSDGIELPGKCNKCGSPLTAVFESNDCISEVNSSDLELDTSDGLSVVASSDDQSKEFIFELVEFQTET